MITKEKFDPGFAPLVEAFSQNIFAVENIMKSLKTPQQKKFRFQMLLPQIRELIRNSIAFYQGCLMWAAYLKNNYPENTAIIEGNPFLDVDFEKENISKDELCQEIDFLINYLEKIEKDTKYYLAKSADIPSEWEKIAKTYKEFLILNNNFSKTKYTSDLILPDIINIKDTCVFKDEIEKAIKEKNLALLLKPQ